jgi:AraC-like DNA-binding protein
MQQFNLYKEYKPHESLQEDIKCFWVLEKEYDSRNQLELVYPDSYIEMIFHFGSPYRLVTPAELKHLPTAFLIGLLNKPISLQSDGITRIVCARFYPWGAYAFFPSYIKQSHNTAASMNFSQVISVPVLESYINKGDYNGAVKELEKRLLEYSVNTFYEKELVKKAAEYLFLKKGQCNIDEVAGYCYRSLRQVQRSVYDELGVSMKSMSKNFRFDEIKKQLIKAPDAALTSIAYEFGFFDQAHFIKEFRSFTGKTPSEFCNEIREIKKAWNENIVFLSE